jgi:predicted ABC-type ATPase
VSARRLTADDFPVPADVRAEILADLTKTIDFDFQPSSSPQLVFVTGQPAAGKSRTVDRLSAQLDTPAVVLDSDVLRLNHPSMPLIMNTDPQRMDVLSNGPVGEWMRGLIEHSARRGYNTIIENTLTAPDQVANTAEKFRQAGFEVSVAALAVDESISRLGIVSRYLAGIDHDDFPRWTTENSHTGAYTGMLAGLAAVDGVVDTLDVFDRSGQRLYHGADGVAAAKAVIAGREASMDSAAIATWAADYAEAVPRLLDPDMITDQTRTVLTGLTADAQRLLPPADLPEHHDLLCAVLSGEQDLPTSMAPSPQQALDLFDSADLSSPVTHEPSDWTAPGRQQSPDHRPEF